MRTLIATVMIASLVGAVLLARRNDPLAVPVARAQADVPVVIYGLGTVEARVLSRVGFQVGGTIVDVSRPVRRGFAIAR